jgi:hypothetical protein
MTGLGAAALVGGGAVGLFLAAAQRNVMYYNLRKSGLTEEQAIAQMPPRPKELDWLPGYAGGGIAGLYGPQVVKVGEEEPEAILPLSMLGGKLGGKILPPYIEPEKAIVYPTGSQMVQVPPKAPSTPAPAYSGYQAAMDFLNKQPYQPYVPPKPSAVAPARETDVFYSQPYPSVGTRTPDAFAKNRTAPNIVVNVTFRDITIDIRSLENMKRTMALQTAKEVCDAVKQQTGLG